MNFEINGFSYCYEMQSTTAATTIIAVVELKQIHFPHRGQLCKDLQIFVRKGYLSLLQGDLKGQQLNLNGICYFSDAARIQLASFSTKVE
jgi:hypothetical protein